mgnify:CR=1 FL=1
MQRTHAGITRLRQQPPRAGLVRPKLRYAHQGGVNPPLIINKAQIAEGFDIIDRSLDVVDNTGQPGYTSFNRYYFAQQDKKGAVIDERYNGGGSAADYIIDVLQRDFDGYFNNVAGDRVPFTSPAAGIWGPKVMIINEMAGSGGDLMPYMFKRRKIGPLVGKRTWGGLVHTALSEYVLPGLFTLGLVVFVWGTFQYYIQGGSDEEAREKAKALMMYGILLTILMILLWWFGRMFTPGS